MLWNALVFDVGELLNGKEASWLLLAQNILKDVMPGAVKKMGNCVVVSYNIVVRFPSIVRIDLSMVEWKPSVGFPVVWPICRGHNRREVHVGT
jgi:hypothetical protein